MIPYTPIDVIASRKRSPMLMSVTQSGVGGLPDRWTRPKGMTRERGQRRDDREHGARKCTAFSAGGREVLLRHELDEVREALQQALRADAVGPSRACMNPMIRRSASTMTKPTIAGTSATSSTTLT
jgi:hypothetical protein